MTLKSFLVILKHTILQAISYFSLHIILYLRILKFRYHFSASSLHTDKNCCEPLIPNGLAFHYLKELMSYKNLMYLYAVSSNRLQKH